MVQMEGQLFSQSRRPFIVDAATNRRNEGWVDSDPLELSYWFQVHKTTKDPVSVMMLRIVASDSKKMPHCVITS
jgi:hypothetical protein